MISLYTSKKRVYHPMVTLSGLLGFPIWDISLKLTGTIPLRNVFYRTTSPIEFEITQIQIDPPLRNQIKHNLRFQL